jgi:hypothetical protein
MPASLKAIAGDTITRVRATCKDANTSAIVDLTSTTVKLKYRINDGVLQTRTMTVVSPPTSGIVEYQFVTGDLTEGWFVGEIEITDNASLKINTSSKIFMDIEAKV